MKKFLLLFAALLTLSVAASAQNPDGIPCFVDGDWAYFVNPDAEHEVTVIQYQGEGGEEATELTIPSYATYNGSRYFVTALGESLFSEFNNEGNEEYTHWWSHSTFTKLEKVTIPNTVTKIESRAFSGCTSLTSVTIPNSVTGIGAWAFDDCTGLTSVTIPSSVTEIEVGAFSGCTSLQEFVVEDGNSKYTAIDGVIYNTTRIALIAYPGGKEGAFEIPNSVTEIREFAFHGCAGLSSVTIPSSTAEIGTRAFQGCTGLTSVTIPNSVTEIGWQAFDGCTSLTSVTIPNSVTEIGMFAFQNCTGLTSVTIPNSVIVIKNWAFSGCTGLTSVTIPNSVTGIAQETFSGCTGLTSVTIPNSVTGIGWEAFSGCTGLTSVIIGSSVTKIGAEAFSGCTALETIYALPATPPACESNTFENVPETAVVYIPKGSFKAYFVADGWTHFTDFREMGALDITLSESSISIEEGKTATLTATVTKDSDVAVESESWTSSDPEVATVDSDGLVTAVGAGSATISYTVVDGYGVPHSESCEVMVSAMTGIEGITAEGGNAPAEFFTLSGVRVNGEALTPGLYIKRRGGKASKVLVK